ncbi:MAG: sensor domain-containing protein [Solirubrobacterales bacterium]|nr:sensor domain-containing protein [Solirubrobacterales bacterium]
MSVGVGTAITLFGVPVLIGMVFAWRALARFERRLLDLTLGLELGDPYRPLKSAGAFGHPRERLADPSTWKDLDGGWQIASARSTERCSSTPRPGWAPGSWLASRWAQAPTAQRRPTRRATPGRLSRLRGRARERLYLTAGAHCASARSPTPSSASGVGTSGLSRRYHSASSAA